MREGREEEDGEGTKEWRRLFLALGEKLKVHIPEGAPVAAHVA